MAAVVLEQISKIYPGGVEALRDLTLQAADGELLVLVGPSGCGKTTTLRLIAGLEEPTSGSISLGGRNMKGVPPRERNVAMVFQRPALYPHMDVRHNLAFGLKLRQDGNWLTRAARRWLRPEAYAREPMQRLPLADRITQTARLMGLEDVLDRLPSQLSGGQQQRLALGRALVRQPEVFLLDEPLSHLDGQLRAELRHELHLLQRRLRATMVYVTHDQAEAMTLADRLVVMDRGVLQQADRPLAVYDKPCNRFVAGFLGWPAMNFGEGQLVSVGGELGFAVMKPASRWLPLPRSKAAEWAPFVGRPLVVGIRPEDIEPVKPGWSEADLAMKVVLVEPLGHATLVTFERDGWQVSARLPARSAGGERRELALQQNVEVYFHMEHGHLFDGLTGMALSGSASSSPAG